MPSAPPIVFAFDLGTRCGFAEGVRGAAPSSIALLLKPSQGTRADTFSNLIEFLAGRFHRARPALVVKEAPMNLGGFAGEGSSAASVAVTFGLHAIVEGMCSRFDVPLAEAYDSTIRKHFTGKGRHGSREATKAAVIARCHQLGYLPRDCWDEDRADACAVWDWGVSTGLGLSPATLVLYPPQKARK